ncbi:MAG: hypothetical protein ABL897_11990 [Hyphomicrobium sp.]
MIKNSLNRINDLLTLRRHNRIRFGGGFARAGIVAARFRLLPMAPSTNGSERQAGTDFERQHGQDDKPVGNGASGDVQAYGGKVAS